MDDETTEVVRVKIRTADVFEPLLAPARYKGAWGGPSNSEERCWWLEWGTVSGLMVGASLAKTATLSYSSVSHRHSAPFLPVV